MTNPIALVGMACVYPDANSPAELWENVLAGRRAFRRLPPERLRAEDYWSADPTAPDRSYAIQAAVIEGYEFDRVAFGVAGSSYKAADPAHWLALDVAARAMADAGFAQGAGLPRETTGVFLGNTLTGETSRANALRLRWPYVLRTTLAALQDEGWSTERCTAFLNRLELRFKAPFPPVGEETLAGGLSNTIAGRICNHFDLKGCGYTVDGACASSLLAIDHACSALAMGDLDVALAGGVDLSLDPFELVGFSKAGALAHDAMRIYDARSAGFWPGEGCGVVVLMRLADALAQGRRVVAVIRGWGLSSDGQGGLTRPEVEGQLLALRRAYFRAGFGIETVTLFEGHGTGTSVGDATELRALSRARREAAPGAPPAAIGSIKSNIGHTKASAGVAGLIKAALALDAQIVPPTTGCEEPHPELIGDRVALRVLSQGEPWPANRPLRAGCSAMGFGGINAHVVLESIADRRRTPIGPAQRGLLFSAQDAELILLGGRDALDLRDKVDHILSFASQLSLAELADLADHLARTLDDRKARAAIVAAPPAELADRLTTLRTWLEHRGERDGYQSFDQERGIFVGFGELPRRIGFVFPGQGSVVTKGGGAWRRRFSSVDNRYARSELASSGDLRSTAVAQPAIVTASIAALSLMNQFGIEAAIAVGHSLGELTALHWAGAFDGDTLLRIAMARGQAMSDLAGDAGAMASLAVDRKEVEALLDGEPVAIAGLNGQRQTVVSGPVAALTAVITRARERGFEATMLPVSHAFHSPMVAGAVPALARALERETIGPLQRCVVSTVTGTRLAAAADLRELLLRQVTSPVRFAEAMSKAADGIDLWIEVGPGRVLSGLVPEFTPVPIVAIDAGGPSLFGLLAVVGAAFALGVLVTPSPLILGRFTRPLKRDRHRRFFMNPCERPFLPQLLTAAVNTHQEADNVAAFAETVRHPNAAARSLELFRSRVAAKVELPCSAVKDHSRLLHDLHLNSIAVGQLVAEAARALGIAPPTEPTAFANATVAEVAQALDDLAHTGNGRPHENLAGFPPGVGPWIRSFTVALVDRPLPQRRRVDAAGPWRVIAPPGHTLAEKLRQALSGAQGARGLLACLPPEPDERHVRLLLESAQALFAEPALTRFVLVQHEGGAASFARTLHLEAQGIDTSVVDVPVDHPRAVEWIIAEAEATCGFTEVHYDKSGRRREPVLRLLSAPLEDQAIANLGAADVVLVTGGGKGIAAECALVLARETGVRLALMGRSEPGSDSELAANLERMTASGAAFCYVSADVANRDAVRAAVGEVEAALGPITAVVHGAGINIPRLLATLDEPAFLRTLAPKVRGARNILEAVDATRLRLLVTFGSIIARTGLRGEADYAVANEWLARLTERFGQQNPRCRCLNLEWSVWSGVGMGERLGRLEALANQGITPILPDQGVSQFRSLVGSARSAVSVVVSGRFGNPPTLTMERNDLPLLRFLERPRVDYPGVELVVDATLATETDLYLDDHVFQGERLFPAVLGLEAMAQVTMAVLRVSVPPVFEDSRFDRPVVAPPGRQTAIRLAALVREPGLVDVVLRSETTAFQLDHFRATCRFEGDRALSTNQLDPIADLGDESLDVPLDPRADLYGQILFQKGRFQKLRGYRRLRATECVAAIATGDQANWFGRYLPGQFVLGDPATRDAAIHAVQACIPHATILPVGVERLIPCVFSSTERRFVIAKERSDEGDILIYDLEVADERGVILERWKGLKLRVVKRDEPRDTWPLPLLGPYLERQLKAVLPGSRLSVEVESNGNVDPNARSDRALQRASGRHVPIVRRPDGKPELARNGNISVSATHARDVTLAIAGPDALACDVEPAIARSAFLWRDLLGPERWELAQLIMRATGEDITLAATRAWVASECLTKVGVGRSVPLVLRSSTGSRDVLLGSGLLAIATFVLPEGKSQHPLVVGLLTRHDDASL